MMKLAKVPLPTADGPERTISFALMLRGRSLVRLSRFEFSQVARVVNPPQRT
jgi:hypothetical protein